MVKFIRKYSETIIVLILFSIILILKRESLIDEKLLFGLMGTVATLYFGIIKFKIENDILFKELFNSFNEKYDNNFNDLLNELKDKPKYELSSKEKNLVIDYLNLCAEEYLWRTRNRIPNNVWNSWKAGIKENLNIKQINEIYIKEISTLNSVESYYGLVKELKIDIK
jgi:hypothetical protein